MAKNKKRKEEKPKDFLGIYLKEIGKVSLLTKEEEIDLLKKKENGDSDARETFIKANLRLVVYVAKKYFKKSVDLTPMGLIQEGNMALIRAVDNFDWRSGNRFSTYAQPCIEFSLIRTLSRYYKKKEIYTLSLDVCSEEDSNDMYQFLEDAKSSLPEFSIDRYFLKETLIQALSNLEETEREVINLSFGLLDGIFYDTKEIAKKLKMKKKKILNIKEKALKKLKKDKRLIKF